jgi:hypothetical protein
MDLLQLPIGALRDRTTIPSVSPVYPLRHIDGGHSRDIYTVCAPCF